MSDWGWVLACVALVELAGIVGALFGIGDGLRSIAKALDGEWGNGREYYPKGNGVSDWYRGGLVGIAKAIRERQP